MNRFNRSELSRFLLENEVLGVYIADKFPIRNVQTSSPIMINYAKMVQPQNAAVLAENIALTINEWDAEVDKKTTLVSGYDFSNVLAHRVAEILNIEFLPVKDGGYVDKPSRMHHRVIHVGDTLGTGHNTTIALNAMWAANHKCDGICFPFDFGFNLHSKELRNTEIRALINLDDLRVNDVPIRVIAEWKKANPHLFGDYGRWQKPAPEKWRERGEVNSM